MPYSITSKTLFCFTFRVVIVLFTTKFTQLKFSIIRTLSSNMAYLHTVSTSHMLYICMVISKQCFNLWFIWTDLIIILVNFFLLFTWSFILNVPKILIPRQQFRFTASQNVRISHCVNVSDVDWLDDLFIKNFKLAIFGNRGQINFEDCVDKLSRRIQSWRNFCIMSLHV